MPCRQHSECSKSSSTGSFYPFWTGLLEQSVSQSSLQQLHRRLAIKQLCICVAILMSACHFTQRHASPSLTDKIQNSDACRAFDMLPVWKLRICRVLEKLQDQAEPQDFEDTKRTLETELGAELDSFFEDFEPDARAAASLAQASVSCLSRNSLFFSRLK